MILIKNIENSIVLYAGTDLILSEQCASSFFDNWVDFNTTTQNSIIDTGILPLNWTGGSWSYANNVWKNIIPPSPPTLSEFESAIQSQLDTYAQSWGYNDIATACTYVGSTVPKFSNEGTALRNWRDSTWLSAETLVSSIQAGTAQMPATIDAALSLMPVEPTRPS